MEWMSLEWCWNGNSTKTAKCSFGNEEKGKEVEERRKVEIDLLQQSKRGKMELSGMYCD